jgi:hypothetical protein
MLLNKNLYFQEIYASFTRICNLGKHIWTSFKRVLHVVTDKYFEYAGGYEEPEILRLIDQYQENFINKGWKIVAGFMTICIIIVLICLAFVQFSENASVIAIALVVILIFMNLSTYIYSKYSIY